MTNHRRLLRPGTPRPFTFWGPTARNEWDGGRKGKASVVSTSDVFFQTRMINEQSVEHLFVVVVGGAGGVGEVAIQAQFLCRRVLPGVHTDSSCQEETVHIVSPQTVGKQNFGG